jgi:23S rRNA (uridine2552-2'-O)-methyltransferase
MAKPYDPKDFYFRKAKKAGLRARSAFKIEEILHRHRLLAHGDAVLDLGAAPGGFLQILAEAVGERGVAVGVDLEPIRHLGKPWVRTAIVDLLAPDALDKIRALHPGRFRLVTSDMAPKTIGIKVADEARSLELVRMALSVAERTLLPGGAFVAKVFVGGDFPVLKREVQARFESIHVVRPEATREASYEVYVVGKGYRVAAPALAPAPAAALPTSLARPEGQAPAAPLAPAERAGRPTAAKASATKAPPTEAPPAKAPPAKASGAKPGAKPPAAKASAAKRTLAPRRRPHPKSAPPSRARR